MATRQDGCKVVKPILPSLLHYACVKISVLLFEEFGVEVLKEAFDEIHSSTTSEGSTADNRNRAKQIQLRRSSRIQKGNTKLSEGSAAESRNRAKEIQLHTPPQMQHGNSATRQGSTTESRSSSKQIQLHISSQIQQGNSTASDGSTAIEQRKAIRNRAKETRLHTPPQIQFGNSTSKGSTAESRNSAKQIQLHTSQIQHGNSTPSEESTVESRNRAKQILLLIPSHLRRIVMKAVFGCEHAVKYWKWYHSIIFRFKEEGCHFHWRSIGSIDENKTAQNLVRNAKFDRRQRFKIACVYCLEESVRDLWAEMVDSGEVESFGPRHLENDIVGFWVEHMRARSLVPWTQSLTQSLGTFIPNHPPIHDFSLTLVPRCSVIFPLLPPEERQKFFHLLGYGTFDDLRLCLYTATKNEEQQILTMWAPRCLRVLLEWPFQTSFLETAEKLWNYINGGFCDLLVTILSLKDSWMDFNYSDIFERFWNMSPDYFRESVRRCPHSGPIINSYLDEKKKEKENL